MEQREMSAEEVEAGAGGGQFVGSDLLVEEADCRVFVGDRELGTGTIKVTESDVSWSSVNGGESITLEYPKICVHAISRDTSVFPWPSLYILYSASPQETASSDDEDDTDEEEEVPPMEVRVVPPHTEQLEDIYGAICDCQLLYPDPDLSDTSEEREELDHIEEIAECPSDFFTSAEGLQHLTAEGEVVLAHLESVLHINEEMSSQNGGETNLGQFEDAEENTAD